MLWFKKKKIGEIQTGERNSQTKMCLEDFFRKLFYVMREEGLERGDADKIRNKIIVAELTETQCNQIDKVIASCNELYGVDRDYVRSIISAFEKILSGSFVDSDIQLDKGKQLEAKLNAKIKQDKSELDKIKEEIKRAVKNNDRTQWMILGGKQRMLERNIEINVRLLHNVVNRNVNLGIVNTVQDAEDVNAYLSDAHYQVDIDRLEDAMAETGAHSSIIAGESEAIEDAIFSGDENIGDDFDRAREAYLTSDECKADTTAALTAEEGEN